MMIKDPIGQMILFNAARCIPAEVEALLSWPEKVVMALEKPAFIVEQESSGGKEHFYYRSINWNENLLLRVSLRDGTAEVMTCELNPPAESIHLLLKEGKKLYHAIL